MSKMTVRELIDALENMPPDFPVVIGGVEITEVTETLIRDELYLTDERYYDEGLVVKIY